MRQLKLRMSDETIRTVMVDENQPVANLMVIICTKLGITNHDEYSLIATGKHTINGRRREKLDGRIIDQKMEQLKKKLRTDEDLAWVDHSKTLDEQEIHEQDVVLLRRRFFYSDHNVDSRDPLQLGLLYVQTRDAILSGTHPVTADGACKFAGIQCQAQLGDFSEGKTTRAGYMNLKDYLPADYVKHKHIERKVFNEHKKYYGLTELEAKAKYVSEARSLPTYGVTFFLVKEKVSGKSKLVPRLLGLTKDCVMRVDADTKAILKTWPLTTVKRWAPSKNSFTLDFGDYSDSYYSVQTTEGEQIGQLIAGYIDIILRRRKPKDHFGIEGDEGATMVEDSVAPSRATIIRNQPALSGTPAPPTPEPTINSSLEPHVQKLLRQEGPIAEPPDLRPAFEVLGKAEIGYESQPSTQYVTNYNLTLSRKDLQDRLELAEDAVEEAQKVLDRHDTNLSSKRTTTTTTSSTEHYNRKFAESNEMEQKKKKLSDKFTEINLATAELVSLSSIPEEELNYPALNNAVETVASSLPNVAKDVKYVASHMEDEESGERLIDAARKLCRAFSDLLSSTEPGSGGGSGQNLISAASRVGDATQALVYTINGVGGHNNNNSTNNENVENGISQSAAHKTTTTTTTTNRTMRTHHIEQVDDSGDQEASVMFSTAGTMRSEEDYDIYYSHRENVLRCAKALVDDIRPLTESSTSDERQLAQAVQESVVTMSQLAETVKQSAASLGPENSDSQMSLIRSVKEVAKCLAALIESTKSTPGCDQDVRLQQVRDSAKSMVASVTSLLRTVKSVEDEQQRPPFRNRNLSLR